MGAQGRRLTIGAVGTAALIAAACGGEDDFANDPRPPSPVVVTARIGPERVDVAPGRLGAGPIELIVTNQTDDAQRVTLAGGEDAGPGLRQQTPPINPSSTASLKIDVRQGEYRLGVDRGGIRAARLRVGERRPSAQNQLLQP